MTHEHRPDLAAQRAALAVARAELTGDHEAAIGAAEALCGVCLALTITNYWIAVAAILDGNRTGMVTERVRRRLLAAADAAEAELRASPN
jgi:hypothetical protein